MPMPERYGCIDIDERRVIPDIEIREAVINGPVMGTGTWGIESSYGDHGDRWRTLILK